MSSTHHLTSPTNESHDVAKLDKYSSCSNTGHSWSLSSNNSVKKDDDSGGGISIGLIDDNTATNAGDGGGCYGGRFHGQQTATGAVDPSAYYLAMAHEYCRTLQAATGNAAAAAAAAAATNSLGDYACPTQQLMTNVMMASMAVAALMPQHITTAGQPFNNAQCKFQSTAATATTFEHFLNPYSINQSPFSENQYTSKDHADSSVGSLDVSIDDFHPNTPNSSLVDDRDLIERNEDEKSVWNSSINRSDHNDRDKDDYLHGNQSAKKQKPIGEEISYKKKKDSLSTAQYLTEKDEAELLDGAIFNEIEHKCDYRERKVTINKKSKKLPENECTLTGQEDVMEGSGDEGTLACCDDEMQQVSNQFSPSSAYYGSPIHDPSLFNKYPMIIVSPQGTIAVYLRESCIVEMTVNRTLRVECQGKFSAASNWQGNTNGILHADARILQQDTRVQCLFGKNKVASFGPQGVIVNMKPSTTAYVVSSTMFKGTTAIPASSLRLPSMDYDFTMAVFYSQPNNVAQALACCQEIIRRNAKHFERQDGSLSVNINGVNIRQDRFGNVSVNCRPRTILLSPQKNTVSVRTHFVDMAVQEDEKAYVKRGVKRVHVSKSGMVVSDGECITAMDHYGRIVSST